MEENEDFSLELGSDDGLDKKVTFEQGLMGKWKLAMKAPRARTYQEKPLERPTAVGSV